MSLAFCEAMRQIRTNSKMAAVVAAILFATARAAAQEGSARVIVSIPDCKVALLDNGRVVKIYDAAVGAPVSPTPAGTFRVVNRIPNPTYYHPGKVIGPGKANPLGTRWIGLSTKGFGIHGTNQPRSIGHAASHGCVRMRTADLQELFEIVKVGDVVEMHAERDEVVVQIFGDAGESGATTLTAAVAAFGPGAAQ